MGSPGAFCISCGAALQPDHRFCPKCGAERWTPAGESPAARPPPGPGTQPFERTPPVPAASPRLRWLPFVFAAGSIFWLIQLVQFAAVLSAPAGRDQLRQALTQAGLSGDVTTLLVAESVIVVLFMGTAAALHAAAYFGLRALRPWGWITAVIVAAAWSLILVGIPVLLVLLRRTTRRAYGIS